MLDELIDGIARKKARLDRLRPLRADAVAQLQKHYDVELTYTSNATDAARDRRGHRAWRHRGRQVSS